MDRQAFIDWLKQQKYAGKIQAGTPRALARLDAGRTDIAQRSGLPEETVLLMVKCCNLCRMTGMAGQALRRSLAMGYDTLDTFRTATPEGIRADVAAYLERTGERSNTMIDYAGFIQQAIDLED